MDTDIIPKNFDLPPWNPTTNASEIRSIGKAQEECAELMKILARCLIQGVDGVDPETGKTNRDALAEEIADVTAALSIVSDDFDLDPLSARVSRKRLLLRLWREKLAKRIAEDPTPGRTGEEGQTEKP